MISKQTLGKNGEDEAVRYVLRQGMKLETRNYRAGKGEIDIVARDGDTFVFIEVKTRSNMNYGTAAEAVGYRKQQMILKTAQYFVAERGIYDENIRFDVAEVYAENGKYSVCYLKNAFGL